MVFESSFLSSEAEKTEISIVFIIMADQNLICQNVPTILTKQSKTKCVFHSFEQHRSQYALARCKIIKLHTSVFEPNLMMIFLLFFFPCLIFFFLFKNHLQVMHKKRLPHPLASTARFNMAWTVFSYPQLLYESFSALSSDHYIQGHFLIRTI